MYDTHPFGSCLYEYLCPYARQRMSRHRLAGSPRQKGGKQEEIGKTAKDLTSRSHSPTDVHGCDWLSSGVKYGAPVRTPVNLIDTQLSGISGRNDWRNTGDGPSNHSELPGTGRHGSSFQRQTGSNRWPVFRRSRSTKPWRCLLPAPHPPSHPPFAPNMQPKARRRGPRQTTQHGYVRTHTTAR